ncbi:ATP-binding protein [Sphaerisporangium sp. NPDC051017]|uniref:sensor histidine kinase n=1 Tax=Sphaerisporangium sp. NPDC051017 TaxID=3154636 RepID=UPI0034278961
MSLRLRLSLLFTLGIAIAIAIAGMVFLAQLQSGLNTALDETLRARGEAVTTRLAAIQATARPIGGDQRGDYRGEFSESEQVTQVLTPEGAVLESTAGPATLLTAAQLKRASEGSLFFTGSIEGERVRVLAMPARRAGDEVIAAVGESTGVIEEAQARARTAIWAVGASAVAVAGFGAWLVAGAALHPVTRMRRRLANITEHSTDARLRVPRTRDEIASLAEAMNGLLDRLQRALARQRGFVADAGHELRTPLTALKAELELAARPGRDRETLTMAISAAAADTERLIRLAEDLLLLARADEGAEFLQAQPITLSDLVAASVRSSAATAATRTISMELDADPSIRIVGDPDRLRQVVDNLLGNALRHAPEGSTVGLNVRTATSDGEPVAVIEVSDRGPGFPPEFLPYAFERFRRADAGRARTQGGVGLGLAVVASIANAHGGRARAENRPGGGARVWAEFPLRRPRGHSRGRDHL